MNQSISIAIAIASLTLIASGCSSHSVESVQATPERTALGDYQSPADVDNTTASAAVESAQSEVGDNTDTAQAEFQEQPNSENTDLAAQQPENKMETTAAHPETTLFRFGFDKPQLDDENATALAEHGQYLAQHPQQRITINGHADQQGDQVYNEQLSLKRAQYVAQVLKDNGATAEQIEIFSFGSTDPLEDATHPRQNRRVELIYADHPHYANETDTPETSGAEQTLSAVKEDLESKKASATDLF